MKRGSTAGNRSFLLGSDECLRKRALWTRRDWSAPRPCLVPVPFSLSASPHISREKQTAISLGSSVCSTQFQVVLFIMPCKVETPVIQKKVDSLNCSFNFVLEILSSTLIRYCQKSVTFGIVNFPVQSGINFKFDHSNEMY